MSDEDSPAESESSINDHYASEFRQHLAQVQAHLAGNDGKALHPSYIPPTGYWTSLEKDAFFHGLSIHSRFRPDLIAVCVRTKSVVDVCAYIDALDKGLSKNAAVQSVRAEIEGSVEVSDAWVQWEEKRAVDLISLEYDWEEEMLEKQREEGGDEGVQEGNSRRYWNQEKTMRRLDVHHLRVMEAIIRDGEGGEPADHSSPSARAHITDEMIDPVLEISGVSLPAPEISCLHSSNGESAQFLPLVGQDHDSFTKISQPDTLDPVEEPTMNPSEFSPTSRRRLQKRLYMRKKRAEKTGSEFTSVGAKLRPGRKAKEMKSSKPRRRIYKNENNSPEDDPDTDSMNIDDGPMDLLLSAASQDTIEDSEQEEDEDNATERARHSKSGLTKPYKIKKEFASQEIDASVLLQGNLGLFHLSTLSRLMTLYKSGYSKAGTAIATTISADTIRLMTAIVVEFTSEVVYRTIISREQEKFMKGNIKIYGRMHDDITPENVDHVLEMMGVKGLTKAQYFATLLDEEMPTTSEKESGPGDEYSASDNDDPLDQDSMGADGSGENENDLLHLRDLASFPALLSLQRELHPPLIHLPKSFTNGNSSLEESLVLMDVDETELLNELQEEQELDDADGTLAKKYEAELWKNSRRGNVG